MSASERLVADLEAAIGQYPGRVPSTHLRMILTKYRSRRQPEPDWRPVLAEIRARVLASPARAAAHQGRESPHAPRR